LPPPCFPPFKILKQGVGIFKPGESSFLIYSLRYKKRGKTALFEAALAMAMDTDRVVFEPSFDLFCVPSS
jgi:hypothetical protein